MTFPFSATGKPWLDAVRSRVRADLARLGSDAHNALETHADGTTSVRTGFIPIEIAGYPLPDRGDPERLKNRDVYRMDADGCDAELRRLDAALAARARLRTDEGVRDVIVLKERGSTSFEEWADERRDAIARRMLYGR